MPLAIGIREVDGVSIGGGGAGGILALVMVLSSWATRMEIWRN